VSNSPRTHSTTHSFPSLQIHKINCFAIKQSHKQKENIAIKQTTTSWLSAKQFAHMLQCLPLFSAFFSLRNPIRGRYVSNNCLSDIMNYRHFYTSEKTKNNNNYQKLSNASSNQKKIKLTCHDQCREYQEQSEPLIPFCTYDLILTLVLLCPSIPILLSS